MPSAELKYTKLEDDGALIVVTAPPIVEMPEAEAMFHELQIAHEGRHSQFSCIIDCTRVTHIPGAAVRKTISDFDRSLAEIDKRWNAGSATVIPNAAVRGSMMAVYWLAPPVYPHRFFDTLAGAITWCRAELAKAQAPQLSA